MSLSFVEPVIMTVERVDPVMVTVLYDGDRGEDVDRERERDPDADADPDHATLRLMRQVEHLISTILNQPRSVKIKNYHRAASALGASDLASWCTLLLQANGGMPEVMKVKGEF